MSCSMCHISRVQKRGSWIKSSIENQSPLSGEWLVAMSAYPRKMVGIIICVKCEASCPAHAWAGNVSAAQQHGKEKPLDSTVLISPRFSTAYYS